MTASRPLLPLPRPRRGALAGRYERLHLGQGCCYPPLELAGDDLLLGGLDLAPDACRDVGGLEERDAPVRKVQVVTVDSVGAILDVLKRLREDAREAPQLRGEQDVLRVDRGYVADVADVPDLVSDAGV